MLDIRRSLVLFLAFALIETARSDDKIDFAHDVAPVLKKHCVACHGGKETKGGFSMNTRELLLEAEAAVPRQAGKSRMIELIESRNPDEQMPPKDRPRLAAAEIAALRRWIDQGLPWEAGFTFAESRYEPPLRPRRVELPPAAAGRENPVDRILDAYLAEHQISAPEAASDAEFLRRVSLDIVGLLPEPEALDAFLADASPDKRGHIVRALLADDIGYAEHWLTFWNDLLRNDYAGTGFITGGRKQISAWLYRSLVDNKPYDQFVRELISPRDDSDGFIRGIRWRGNVNASQTPEIQFAQNISQAFLGINLKCASCHDSFIDHWTLAETYNLAQVYSNEPLTLHRCDKPLDKQAQAAWLFPELGEIDVSAPQPQRLEQLAALMTHPENGRFTRTIVNRIWHRLMGRGIVHPVDAMHTEPWSADLLDYLAGDLAEHGYDLKQTIALICTSHAYQAKTPRIERLPRESEYVYRGPLARRTTAEQFADAVWRITGAAPGRFDAPVQRFKTESSGAGSPTITKLTGRWVWSYPEAAGPVPKAGETITLRRQFDMPAAPVRAVAAITCDNEYTLYVNQKQVLADANWETVEVADLVPQLRPGKNEILIVAKNAGGGPNPAGLFFEVRFRHAEGAEEPLGTDDRWQWTAAKPDARGRFKQDPGDWKPAAVIPNAEVWSSRVEPQIVQQLTTAGNAAVRMVRASLLKNDAFMTALGRPTRDQIVSMRPSELTTLEAIDLANGQALADAIAAGAGRLAAQFGSDPDGLTHWLFAFALSRSPTAEEKSLARELLGSEPTQQGIEDLLWSVFMLPEFQLVR